MGPEKPPGNIRLFSRVWKGHIGIYSQVKWSLEAHRYSSDPTLISSKENSAAMVNFAWFLCQTHFQSIKRNHCDIVTLPCDVFQLLFYVWSTHSVNCDTPEKNRRKVTQRLLSLPGAVLYFLELKMRLKTQTLGFNVPLVEKTTSRWDDQSSMLPAKQERSQMVSDWGWVAGHTHSFHTGDQSFHESKCTWLIVSSARRVGLSQELGRCVDRKGLPEIKPM